ncbi:MAG: hypothetical protein J6P03_03820 [Opitutales bacterium]|nr:hypothetical protein [Opitutales bacterium]
MSKRDFQKAVEAILNDDKRYAVGAYVFVRMALDYTVKNIDKIRAESGGAKRAGSHVSAAELLEGIRIFGLETFGQMMSVLLETWGVKKCSDFGEIVFNLIKVGELSKTDDDKIEDFTEAYDFREAFVCPYLPKNKGVL